MTSNYASLRLGTSLIEFAIVLPVLIFLADRPDRSRPVRVTISIVAANAARAGVQYGAQSSARRRTRTGIKNAAIADGLNLSNWTASDGASRRIPLLGERGDAAGLHAGTGSGPPTNTTYYVQVQVTGTFNSMMNYPGIPTNVPVSGSAIMRVISQ